ncbi:hypothetical protein CROQUDRAFT_52115 [Cronartium quercuum f. sp. fusiforme G11]|uniref:Glycosyltransferase family 32 protein n=1 Tax=Cronartium quercuum f. sp. fusiforme G11 TaxID=708437 RepID=A0A9P6N561_9BASI|nr:hypothetical protein CROQUDRAFT_54879 [Cronartium quercuum f. sp. fusiforme G11]KAG0141182.1 hypothetical protein CROQUDRAFT_52115 [Cronartium quercuum f. sp. fusiforme G11]
MISILSRWKLILLMIVLSIILFRYMIETHVQISFYKRGWISELLPPDPPLVSSKCFSKDYLKNTFDPTSSSFPSSPLYNLSLGTLGLRPKVLTLSPGFDLPHYDDCYRFANTIPGKPTTIMEESSLRNDQVNYFHVYWRSDLSSISERQLITLQSILISQDFSTVDSSSSKFKSHIILWTNPSIRKLDNDPLLSPFIKKHANKISLRVINLIELTKYTSMENHELLNKVFDKKAWLDGDLIRVLVLWNFGGFWIDMDNLVLKDLRVLSEHEWVVMWDCYDKPYEPLNGHIMHFQKQSPYLCEMLDLMSKPPTPRPSSTDWGQHLYHRLYRSLISSGITPFKVLPYCLTDGRSCNLKDRLPDPFDENEKKWNWNQDKWDQIQNRLKGVFSIHLHNQWDKSFPRNGWVWRFYIDHWQKVLGSTSVF